MTKFQQEKPSGESIEVYDSSSLKLKELGISGKSVQETREGYNILNFDVTNQSSKVTINDDGTITINGTGGFSIAIQPITLENGKTYKEKFEIVSGSISAGNINNTFRTFSNSSWLHPGEFYSYVPEEDTEKTSIWLNASTTFDNLRIKFWAYEGTEEKEFEAYGAMPSTDYPSEVNSVGDNVNLFDGTYENAYTNATAATHLYSSSSTSRSAIIKVSPNTTYSILKELSNRFRVSEYSERPAIGTSSAISIIVVGGTSNEGAMTTYSLTTSNDTHYLAIQTTSISEEKVKLKIEPGSTATPYSPYGMGCASIRRNNKNWFNTNNAINNRATGTSLTNKTTNSLTIKGTSTWSNYTQLFENKKQNTDFNISSKIFSSFGRKVAITAYGTDDDVLVGANLTTLGSKNLDIEADIVNELDVNFNSGEYKNIAIRFWNNDTNIALAQSADLTYDEIMMEEGTSASEYKPYTTKNYIIPTQQPMRSIGDAKDDFIKQDGVWYERHKIGYIASYNGEEITTAYMSNTGSLTIGAKVQYVLAEPTLLPCTNEQTAVLEEIVRDGTYATTTYYDSDDDIKPTLNIVYYKDMIEYIKNEVINAE